MMQPKKDREEWPLPTDLDEDTAHEQMRALIKVAWQTIYRNKSIGTLTQVAARLGVSVEELRDDARQWTDTDVRMRRIIGQLTARLHEAVLEMKMPKIAAKGALAILELDLKERQLSSTNRVMVEGTGLQVKIVNYAELESGEPKKHGKKHSLQKTYEQRARKQANEADETGHTSP